MFGVLLSSNASYGWTDMALDAAIVCILYDSLIFTYMGMGRRGFPGV